LEAANALCFGVLQKYTLETPEDNPVYKCPSVVKISEDTKSFGRSHLVFKKMCENFSEENGYDVAAYVWKKSSLNGQNEMSTSAIITSFCNDKEACVDKEVKKAKKKEKKTKKDSDAQWENNVLRRDNFHTKKKQRTTTTTIPRKRTKQGNMEIRKSKKIKMERKNAGCDQISWQACNVYWRR